MSFKTFFNRPAPVVFTPDTKTEFVDQSEARRAALKYQLERFGMDSLQQRLQQSMAQFGYADTRAIKSFSDLAVEMAEANEYFNQLPPEIRKKYGHNPAEFFDQVEKNPSKMYEEGIISMDYARSVGVEKAQQDYNALHPEVTAEITDPVNPVDTSDVQNSVIE